MMNSLLTASAESQELDFTDWKIWAIIIGFAALIAIIMIAQKKSVGRMPADLKKKYEGQIKNSIVNSVAVFVLANDNLLVNYNNKWYEFARQDIAFVYSGKGRNNIGFGLLDSNEKNSNCTVVASKALVNMKPGFFPMSKRSDAKEIVQFIAGNISGIIVK